MRFNGSLCLLLPLRPVGCTDYLMLYLYPEFDRLVIALMFHVS